MLTKVSPSSQFKRIGHVLIVMSLFIGMLVTNTTSAHAVTDSRVGTTVTVTIECETDISGKPFVPVDVYPGDTLTINSKDADCTGFYVPNALLNAYLDPITATVTEIVGGTIGKKYAMVSGTASLKIKDNAVPSVGNFIAIYRIPNAATPGIAFGENIKLNVLAPSVSTPTITAVSASSGSTAGGTSITITGTAFATGATVKVDGIACTNVVVVSATSITCTTPAGSAGAKDVVVTNSDTGSATKTGGFTYETPAPVLPAPTITTVSPLYGGITGGTPITITGTDFVTGATVTVGDNACTNVVVVSATSITCTTPAGSAGGKWVGVVNPDTQYGYLENGFTHTAADVVGWTPHAKPVGNASSYTRLSFGNNYFIATAIGSFNLNKIIRSSDGITWTEISLPAAEQNANCVLNRAVYGGGIWVVSGNWSTVGVGNGYCLLTSSDDGLTWTNHTAPTGDTLTDAITYGNGQFVSVGGGYVLTSPDGINWTKHSTPAAKEKVWNSVAYGNNMYVATANAFSGAYTLLMTSPDGITWTEQTSPISNSLSAVCFANGLFVVTSSNGFLTSPNGIDWTRRTTPDGFWNSVTYGAGRFVAMNSSPRTSSISSSDGITWKLGLIPFSTSQNAYSHVRYGNGIFMALALVMANGSRDFVITASAPLPPTITAVSPTSGSTAGGTSITITGMDFATGATVTVGGAACTNVVRVSATSITCTTPAGTAGARDVVVTNPDGGSATKTEGYTFAVAISTPTITAVSPSSGSTAGGTSITITGTEFAPGATVTVGGAACTNVVRVSATSITCTTPAGSAGARDVVVTNPDTGAVTRTGGFTYNISAPTITAVSPSSGSTAGGTSITITGTEFAPGATVTVGGVACTNVVRVSATSITCTTPAGTVGARDVVVTNPDTGAVTRTGGFTYNISAPTITAVSPTSGSTAGGTSITITGTEFAPGATVTVGGAACTNVVRVSATSITCTTPAGSAGARDVVVTNPDTGAVTRTGGFTYNISAPTITAVSPSSGSTAGGTSITITGTEFAPGATVTVGGAACTNVVRVSATSITCTTPAGSAGARDVVVTNPDTGAVTRTGGFTYNISAPTITAVSPTSGSTAGGTSITITGTEFAPGATVTVGGVACTNVVRVSATSITCTTPAGTAGARDVVVTNPDTGAVTRTGGFTYNISTPTITTVYPSFGERAGGTSITITGTEFALGATVTVGGAACTNVVVVSATSITCTTPAGTAGARDVVVTNPDTGTATRGGGFTYLAPAPIISAPTITAVSPTSGSTAGGTSITITGTDFAPGATVTVGGAACTNVVRVSATSITCTTPAGTVGARDVVVTNPDRGTVTRTGGFTYNISAPTIGGISPSSGSTAGGTSIIITGTEFAPGATVTVGGAACTNVVVVSATSITCTTPAGSAGARDVVVTNPDRGTVTRSGGFTYIAPAPVISAPTIGGISPSSGSTAGGTSITITGTDFAPGATVTVGGAACTNVVRVSATSITCTTPAGSAGPRDVVVTNPDKGSTTKTGGFTYIPPVVVPDTAPITKSFEVFFSLDSSVLDSKARSAIKANYNSVSAMLSSTSLVTVTVTGWVQPTKVNPNVQGLSTGRASAVATYLKTLGLKASYVINAPGKDKLNKASSRRASVVISWTNPKG